MHDMPFKPKLYKSDLERKSSSRFLGLIINEWLTWNQHILAVKAKMNRYVGILYKLKIFYYFLLGKIFHSFVQSHLNYSSLVWGLGPKACIETLSTEQKKAIRALMPGYNINYYKGGMSPCHKRHLLPNMR